MTGILRGVEAERGIVFAAGAYAPHRQAGRGLLAHELAHVIQQRRGPGGMPQARLESEAGRVGHAAARGSGPIALRTRSALARANSGQIVVRPLS